MWSPSWLFADKEGAFFFTLLHDWLCMADGRTQPSLSFWDPKCLRKWVAFQKSQWSNNKRIRAVSRISERCTAVKAVFCRDEKLCHPCHMMLDALSVLKLQMLTGNLEAFFHLWDVVNITVWAKMQDHHYAIPCLLAIKEELCLSSKSLFVTWLQPITPITWQILFCNISPNTCNQVEMPVIIPVHIKNLHQNKVSLNAIMDRYCAHLWCSWHLSSYQWIWGIEEACLQSALLMMLFKNLSDTPQEYLPLFLVLGNFLHPILWMSSMQSSFR